MLVIVSTDRANLIRRPAGSTVTFVNQSAVDVYVDSDPARLNASVAGGTPSGIKIAATGGQVQISDFPGFIYARAATATTIDVLP